MRRTAPIRDPGENPAQRLTPSKNAAEAFPAGSRRNASPSAPLGRDTVDPMRKDDPGVVLFDHAIEAAAFALPLDAAEETRAAQG